MELALPAAVALELVPPVAELPAVKVGNMTGRAGELYEAADAAEDLVWEQKDCCRPRSDIDSHRCAGEAGREGK
jgi:hypothetical protein